MSGRVTRTDVKGCARCGMNHEDQAFHPFTRDVAVDGVVATHWSACPNNGQPILLMITERVS